MASMLLLASAGGGRAAALPAPGQSPKSGSQYDSAEAAYRAGIARLSLDEDAKSQEPLEQALKLAPDDKFKIKVYRALLRPYTLLSEIDKKVEALDFIMDKTDSAAERSLARTELMAFVHQRGKVPALIDRYEARLKKDANDRTALYILAEAYDKLRPNPKRAAELTERLAALTKQAGGAVDAGAQAQLAAQYIKAGKVREGAELYEKVAELDPKLSAWHWKEAAVAWLKLKENDKALAAAKASAAAAPENRSDLLAYFWHRHLGDVFLEAGQPGLAIPHYAQALIKTNIAGYVADTKKKLDEARAKAGPDAPATRDTVVDLNTASLAELQAVPGMTESLAVQIVDRRKKQPFKSVSELIELDGVDKALLDKLRPRVRVSASR